MTTENFQGIDNEASLLSRGYGANLGWRTALINPDGDIVAIRGLGYSSSPVTMQLVFSEIEDYLLSGGCKWTDSELVASSVSQMLGLDVLQNWHNYSLAWGDASPGAAHGQWSNGIDSEWTLYFVANGRNSVVMKGVLPKGWWDLDQDDQYHYLQNN